MSRHRFVRALDLEDEMAEEEYDDGLTPEQKVQMTTGMAAARPLLKDLKPPISDDALYDALYHYWFDVDKSVAYLRKEWEKKGEPIPAYLQPTPEQVPRQRPAKRQRLTPTIEAASPAAGSSSAPAPAEAALQAPLTALQRLSLSRKQSTTSASPASSTPVISQQPHSGPPSAPATPGPSTPGKPMSKLALLAQKRKEAAAAAAGGTSSPRGYSALASPQVQAPSTPSALPTSLAGAASPSPADSAKPLSKLAQKMAAAKAAREQAALAAVGVGSVPMTSSSSASGSGSSTGVEAVIGRGDGGMDIDEPASQATADDPSAAIFASLASTSKSTRPSRHSSAFFSIITSTAKLSLSSFGETDEISQTSNIHLPPTRDPHQLEVKIKQAFEGAESPDDIVLRARQGRAGTAGMTTGATNPALAGSETAATSSASDKAAKPGHATQGKDAPRTAGSSGRPVHPQVRSGKGAGKTTHGGRSETSATGSSQPTLIIGAKPAKAMQTGAPQPAAKSVPPTPKSVSQPGKPRLVSNASVPAGVPAARRQAASQPGTPRNASGPSSSKVSASGSGLASGRTSVASTPRLAGTPESTASDLAGLHLGPEADEREKEKFKERAVNRVKVEELVKKVKEDEESSGKKGISLIVVGHVDAGKSTLMGRLLYEIGNLTEKEKVANERGSRKVGKSSFAFAWGLDALGDERDRGVTIDIATTHFATPHRNITLLDAPGHRDFIPAMISGAAQADVALLVVDGSPGEFEAGFERGGQTREHACLVRSLGVREVIVGVNKLDVVDWDQDRYDDIVDALKPFLSSAGFNSSKTTFVPLAAMEGVNVLSREGSDLEKWYSGPTLIDCLDKVDVPERPYDSPLRIPLSNVFKGQTAIASGVAVSGRLCSGVVQVGDRLRAVPGDEVAVVRTIEVDEGSAPYAVAGQNTTLYLSGIDPIHLAIGTVLCPTSAPVRLVNQFQAQILTFDISTPIIAGTAVELFHHSMNVPANITKLISISEKGQVVKERPRVLQKGVTALVEVTLRTSPGAQKAATIPLEIASVNKEMGRVLVRRGGETIGAGVVMSLIA